ncbi:unnamed protein product [Rotaria sp. Silwood1]|nr:unnamed protein product [Rotaria sp. Silwood1]CAF1210183.1 unnamed protein product [Rotaria sp. Silwood1]CAF3463883.1 unnamed protein product [Rotaria sp. Silwood1]CAF3479598.1 unnamed protein product [Rotaria sp. Silwood1]CAF3540067.1 unnamed protein product [Rotaria sp. Silwood1]
MATIYSDIHTATSPIPLNDQWSCPICSFDNPPSAFPRCNMCKQMNPLSREELNIIDQPILTWQCPRCTLNNKIANERCNACGHNKHASNDNKNILINSQSTSQTSMSLAVRDRRNKDESYAENIFQHIIDYCKQAKTHFVDDQFVPSPKSIGSDSFRDVSQWLRISDVTPLSADDRKLPWTIFSSPQPSDIQQGALGNCWLIAALALVSEQPRLLEHILLTKTVNHEGVYLVRICHNGLWETIIVDDCFPCTRHKHLVFTQAKHRQLYVPLIEKACAKVFGSYASLKSGHLSEGLQLLTGAPCDHIDLKPSNDPLDDDIVWAKLLSACESKLLIGVSSSGTGVSSEEYARIHIHENHAFSILAAHAFANDSTRFVLVRDPHSRSNYTEELVTESVLAQLRLVNAARRSTGAFWISWPRFLRYFSLITISTYNSDHFDIRQQGQFTQSATQCVATYHFHVPQTSLIIISLLYHRHDRTTHTHHTQSFVLCDADELSLSGSVGKRMSILICKRGGFTYWTGSLQAGSYVLIPFSTSFWGTTEKNRDYTVVIHSSVQLDLIVKNKLCTFLADCLISAVMKTGEKMRQNKDTVFYVTPRKLEMNLFVAENLSIKDYLIVDIDMKDVKNIRHSRHSHLSYNTHDCVPPRYRQVIFLTDWVDKHGESAHMNYTYSYQHDTRETDSMPKINSTKYDVHTPRAF